VRLYQPAAAEKVTHNKEFKMADMMVTRLNELFRASNAEDVVCAAIEDLFPSRIASVSSFGTESAVLLHMIALVDRSTPVLFIDTLKHFDETLAYRDQLITRLRLEDVRTLQPTASDVADVDPSGLSWASDPDKCCHLRKTQPLEAAQMRFNALFTGRKRHHGHNRTSLQFFEQDGPRIKVNPLSGWSPRQVSDYLDLDCRATRSKLRAIPVWAVPSVRHGCRMVKIFAPVAGAASTKLNVVSTKCSTPTDPAIASLCVIQYTTSLHCPCAL